MGNEINSLCTFNPMAQQAYQQFLYSQQQQYQQKQRNENPLYDSGYSLVYPEGYPSKTQEKTNNPNYSFNFASNPYFSNQSIFNGDIFAGKYSNDIFANQLLSSKPWEKFTLENQIGVTGQASNYLQSGSQLYPQNTSYQSSKAQANEFTFTI